MNMTRANSKVFIRQNSSRKQLPVNGLSITQQHDDLSIETFQHGSPSKFQKAAELSAPVNINLMGTMNLMD